MTCARTMSFVVVCLATMLFAGSGDNRDSSFKNLASEKEASLKRLLDKTTQHGKSACRNFRSSVQGDDGTIEFSSYNEVDGSTAGLGIIRVDIGWKAKYAYKNKE